MRQLTYDSPKICVWHLAKRMRMLCREWLAGLSEASPETVPHPLPSREQLAAMTHDLPLQCEAFVDEPELYVAHLQASSTSPSLMKLGFSSLFSPFKASVFHFMRRLRGRAGAVDIAPPGRLFRFLL